MHKNNLFASELVRTHVRAYVHSTTGDTKLDCIVKYVFSMA